MKKCLGKSEFSFLVPYIIINNGLVMIFYLLWVNIRADTSVTVNILFVKRIIKKSNML